MLRSSWPEYALRRIQTNDGSANRNKTKNGSNNKKEEDKMLSKLIQIRRRMMKRKMDCDEALIRRLEDNVLLVDAKFGCYLNKRGYDVKSLVEKGKFSLCVALASDTCPERVIHAVSQKMPVVSIPPGMTFGNATINLFGEEIETGLSVIGRISPTTREWFTSRGQEVFSIEWPESEDDSCTNIAAGVLDVRDVIGKYPSRRDNI